MTHYEGSGVTLYHGDCIEVMRGLLDNSVDSIVTDPPYGLGFMGKTWDDLPPGLPWAQECLRVLKPGGHLLAFGGTRTWHRLAVAVEDAGFEMRDSIAWLYGSGFPKSLDVSKAIDKQRDDRAPVDAVRAWLNARRLSAGLSHDAVNKHFGHASNGGGSSSAWMTNPTSRALPTWEQWEALRVLFDFGDEMDAEVWRLNERKGTPGAAWTDREIVGQYAQSDPRLQGWAEMQGHERGTAKEIRGAATTEAASQWQGWGTALKPSHEPVVVGRKPTGHGGILAVIGSHLDRLESEWQARAAASKTPTGGAAGSFARTATSASESADATSSNTVTSWRKCLDDLCSEASTSITGTTSSTTTALTTLSSCLSKLTVESTHPSGTTALGPTSLATAADHLFASAVCASRATLALSATEPATAATPLLPPVEDDSRRAAFEPIVVARKPLAGTVAQNVQEHGTGALNIDGCRVGTGEGIASAGGTRRSGGIMGSSESLGGWEPTRGQGRWPANVVLSDDQAAALDERSGKVRSAGKYTRGKVESSGPAAINIDRAGYDTGQYDDSGGASRFFPTFRYETKAPTRERPSYEAEGVGTGRVTGLGGKIRQCNVCESRSIASGAVEPSCGHGDFRWEEPTSNTSKVAHPTVKPLALMRWLVRLVTPPGGTVLEPFAGSGTTVEACMAEDFQCIAIEREADYLPLIQQRIDRQLAQQAADRAKADAQPSLFDEDDAA